MRECDGMAPESRFWYRNLQMFDARLRPGGWRLRASAADAGAGAGVTAVRCWRNWSVANGFDVVIDSSLESQ